MKFVSAGTFQGGTYVKAVEAMLEALEKEREFPNLAHWTIKTDAFIPVDAPNSLMRWMKKSGYRE